jgi:hypothetical protein
VTRQTAAIDLNGVTAHIDERGNVAVYRTYPTYLAGLWYLDPNGNLVDGLPGGSEPWTAMAAYLAFCEAGGRPSHCAYNGPSVWCGCAYHTAWVLANPGDPAVQEQRAQTIAWMREHPGKNPATGRAMAHPDDYLVPVYGYGATVDELRYLGIWAG